MNNHVINNNSSLADFMTFDERIVNSLVNSQSDNDGFYNRDELCSLLHIAYPTLWRIEKAGILQSQKVGRKNLYSRLDVDALLGSGGFHFPPKNPNPKKAGRKAKNK